jgi:hypothetical protein
MDLKKNAYYVTMKFTDTEGGTGTDIKKIAVLTL